MLKEQAGISTEPSHEATCKHLEHGHCEIVRDVYETLRRSSLNQFTFSFIDSLWSELHSVLYELEHLPEAPFRKLIDAIIVLREARNELRLARFLFDVAEIDPVRRFVLRNKAVLRGKSILHEVLSVWT